MTDKSLPSEPTKSHTCRPTAYRIADDHEKEKRWGEEREKKEEEKRRRRERSKIKNIIKVR